jgi:hypothetical protein
MKVIKLTKKDLLSPSNLLLKADAVIGNQAYPQHVYVSKKDKEKMKKNLVALAKKQFKGAKKNRIDMAVGMEMLNLGPNSSLEDVIKDGYALVDVNSIKKDT